MEYYILRFATNSLQEAQDAGAIGLLDALPWAKTFAGLSIADFRLLFVTSAKKLLHEL